MYKELKCTECGCTTIDTLYTTDDIGTTITGTKYTLPAEITIPKKSMKLLLFQSVIKLLKIILH